MERITGPFSITCRNMRSNMDIGHKQDRGDKGSEMVSLREGTRVGGSRWTRQVTNYGCRETAQ